MPVRNEQSMGEIVEEVVVDHVHRYHIPRANTEPVAAIPFPSVRLTDEVICQAIEFLNTEDMDLPAVAARLSVPLTSLQLALAEYGPRWRRFLQQRAMAF